MESKPQGMKTPMSGPQYTGLPSFKGGAIAPQQTIGHPSMAPEPGAFHGNTQPVQAPPQQMQSNQVTQPGSAPQQVAQDQTPAGGPDKWALDGLHTLKQHLPDADRQWLTNNIETLMLDPKAKNLLVTSSSYPPGSKPLDDIIGHLKNRYDAITK